MEKNKGLGRGIDALFQEINETNTLKDESMIQEIPLDEIRPNPHQPRLHFDKVALQELSDSIKQSGVLQPIVLRASSVTGYEIVAGERRVRASKLAGKSTIPAIVRQLSEEEMIELAILENLQREDLTALEEAEAYSMMMEKLSLTQSEVAARLGKSRPHITNSLRLLKLPNQVKDMLNQEKISMGIARTLLGLKDKALIIPFAEQAVREDLTVRQLEKTVSRMNQEKISDSKIANKTIEKPNYIKASEGLLVEKLGTDVNIDNRNNGEGKIIIEYTSEDDLTRILEALDIILD
ncbi:MAG: ParB/RepB/Spo0J family partition protein [Atopococcus tabaci]|uniref:ParB/RepB/Spo0J family partition protein n=1 Tax=Atopococcus tabaci TaxID=269774 RepID=A0AA43UCJ5_9LACT|nr:ParB/RepB/Spo0J family partition protein [Atopococcus tabaci]